MYPKLSVAPSERQTEKVVPGVVVGMVIDTTTGAVVEPLIPKLGIHSLRNSRKDFVCGAVSVAGGSYCEAADAVCVNAMGVTDANESPRRTASLRRHD